MHFLHHRCYCRKLFVTAICYRSRDKRPQISEKKFSPYLILCYYRLLLMPPKKNTTVGSSSQKTSQKRKNVESESEESSSAPKLRHSSRISSQRSNLTETIRDLELVELSTNRYDLPSSASKFK